MHTIARWGLFILAACTMVACSSANSTLPTQPQPSPTIAAALPNPAPAPAPRPQQPTVTTTPSPAAAAVVTVGPGQFPFLWPAYMPEGMALSSGESRVMGENEIGRDNLGFYLLTFSGDGGKQKVVVGGGAVEPLTLSGDQKQVTVADRKGTLITSGNQHLILIDSDKGTLFVFGGGISEEETLLVADSLLPIDVRDMRARVGTS